ncbi:MAG TPA: GDP-mannose 4,6-dehydratase [Trebonia sp.]
MRALVTGSSGFVGTYLAKSLTDDGWDVTGFNLRAGQDVRNYDQMRNVMETVQPDQVFHLAAVAWPGESITDPRRTFDVNVTGALNVLEAVWQTGSDARILLAGTSEEYGYEGWPDGYTLTEDSPVRPTTPYGVTKLAATTLGMTYARRHHLRVVATRAFNHTGWGRQAVNAESAFARRIVAVEQGLADRVEHGPLAPVRDFSNVRDVVRAYRLLITQEPGIYNIGSGRPVSMKDVLGMLTAASTRQSIKLTERSGLGRPDNAGTFPDVSFAKLRALGWAPEFALEDTLAEVLSYWRHR